jgi:hypothetical protein
MINNYYQYKKDETKIIKVPEGTTVPGKTTKFDFLKRWESYERAGEVVH